MKKLGFIAVALIAGCLLMAGCSGAETTSTKEQEDSFRNPSKEPPAGMSQAMEKAAEAGRASGKAETR